MGITDHRVGYVIADWRTPELARQAYYSIRLHRPGSDVLVVDADAQQLSYSQALNQGIERLPDRIEIVACLNADVKMIEDDRPVLQMFDGMPDLGIVGTRQLDAEDRIAHGGIVAFEDGSPWDLDLRHRCWLWKWTPDTDADRLTKLTFEVPTVAGSVLYARRSMLEDLGGWPEWTDFYYEDTYLCYLARHRGHRVFYTGEVTWRHYGQGSPVSEAWREVKMHEAQQRFIAHCDTAGIPLRIWPDDSELAVVMEADG